MWPLDGISTPGIPGFLLLWAASYAVHLALYFGLGSLLLWVNQYFPERQIPAISGRERKARRTAGAEIRQSLKSLIGTSFCLAAGVYAQTTGWTQTPLALSPINVLWTFVAALILHDAWFYFGHRLMHTKPLYRWHKTHHLSVTPTVWNNDSFSVPDALSVQSFFILLPFVLPIPTAALIALRLFDQTKGMIGHSGYEHFAGRLARWPFPLVATVHHDQHHQRFTYNFANQFTWWDRLFGTLDPSYDEQVRILSNPKEKARAID